MKTPDYKQFAIYELIFIVVCVCGTISYVWYMTTHKPPLPYCEQFANTPSKDIPANVFGIGIQAIEHLRRKHEHHKTEPPD